MCIFWTFHFTRCWSSRKQNLGNDDLSFAVYPLPSNDLFFCCADMLEYFLSATVAAATTGNVFPTVQPEDSRVQAGEPVGASRSDHFS